MAIVQGRSEGARQRRAQKHSVPLGLSARGSGQSRGLPPARQGSRAWHDGQPSVLGGLPVATLARDAESDSVRLWALRSVLSGANAMSKFPALKGRLAANNDELHESTENVGLAHCQNTNNTPVHVPTFLVNIRFKNSKKAPFCLIFSRVQDAFEISKRAPYTVSPS